MTSLVIHRRRADRRLLTVIKVKRAAWTLFGAACIAIPLAVAVFGNLAGIP